MRKKKAKNAKPNTYEEAFDWVPDRDIMDLAFRLIESFALEPGQAAYQQAVENLSSEVFDLAARDAVPHNRENNLGLLAEAIQLVNGRSVIEPWVRLSQDEVEWRKVRRQWKIVFEIQRDLDQGRLAQPPTISELLAIFEDSKCPERHPNNARKKAVHAGWKPTKSPRGRPRSK